MNNPEGWLDNRNRVKAAAISRRPCRAGEGEADCRILYGVQNPSCSVSLDVYNIKFKLHHLQKGKAVENTSFSLHLRRFSRFLGLGYKYCHDGISWYTFLLFFFFSFFYLGSAQETKRRNS